MEAQYHRVVLETMHSREDLMRQSAHSQVVDYLSRPVITNGLRVNSLFYTE